MVEYLESLAAKCIVAYGCRSSIFSLMENIYEKNVIRPCYFFFQMGILYYLLDILAIISYMSYAATVVHLFILSRFNHFLNLQMPIIHFPVKAQ